MGLLDSDPYRFSGPYRVPLEEMFVSAASGNEPLSEPFEQAVREFARAARAQQVPAERVVIALKGMAEAARERTTEQRFRDLVNRAVTLSIAAYYRSE